MKKIFFWLFCLALPWQTRLMLTPSKPEFLSFNVYLSEIFLWLALGFWLASADLKKIRIPRVFLFFCFFVFLSILWSPDKVAAFRLWLFIFDGIMVYLFLREHESLHRGATKIFLFSVFAAAIAGIWQFFHLGSGSEKWLGLAPRGAWNLGDIVVVFGGERWLRAYGPFPHPNIFGGYLAAGILLLAVNFPLRRRGIKEDLIIYFLSAIFFFALFLTFSRSAWIALALASVYFLIKNFSRQTLKYFYFLIPLAAALLIIFLPFIRTRVESSGRLEVKSNTERVESWRAGFEAWKQNPIFGSGAGNNIITNYGLRITDKIQEPPHNIFILALTQIGLLGLLIYLFVWKSLWKNSAARPFLILFFVIGTLDHYLWTLYSGQMLFWTTFAFLHNLNNGGRDGSAGN